MPQKTERLQIQANHPDVRRLTIRMPKDVRNQFKIYSTIKGRSMQELTLDLIVDRLRKDLHGKSN
jgi:hypothetical protein